MLGIPLPSLLIAWALATSPGGVQRGERAREALVYPGYAAFPISAPPSAAPLLTKPLIRDGHFEPGYFVLHFRGGFTHVDEERWEELVAATRLEGALDGAVECIRWRIPEDALVVWIDCLDLLLAVRRFERVDWVGRYQPSYKIDPAIVLDPFGDDPRLLEIDWIPGHPRELVVRALEGLGARVRDLEGASLLVEAAPRTFVQLAHVEGIRRLRESALDASELEALGARGGPALGSARVPAGGAGQKLSLPTTVTLAVTAGLNSKNGALVATDVALLRTSDNDRLSLRDREELTLAFEASVPADALVSAIRVLVEHHEEPRVVSGDIQWKLGRGTLANPTIVRTTIAPLRSGASLEELDPWAPDSLVPNPNDLKVVIENLSQDDDTLLDRVYVEVDYVLPELVPHILSTPSGHAFVGEPYLYDADGTAEASGAAPLVWSLVSAPAGFAIQPATGAVSWTPAATGSFAVSLQVGNAHGSETQAFVVDVGEPPFPSTLLPANPAAIVYCPPERLAFGAAQTQQRLNVFLPRGTAPAEGWPVVLNNRAGGGIAAAPVPSLSDTGGTAALHAFVASGVAVVDFGVTGISNGLGLFYPPGHPSGRYESFRPTDDDPEKDAEWAVQWLKVQHEFPLDEENVCLRGSSHGAILSIWAAMGPERARATGSAQVRASTRVKAVLALQPPTSVWAFDQGPDLTVRMIAHFEQAALPGVPATAFGQVAERLQKDASVMGFAFDSPEARAHNETQAICLLYGEPVTKIGGLPADLTLDAQGFPRLHDTLRQPFIHDSWAGYVLFRRLLDLSPRSAAYHRVHSAFAVRNTTALAPPFDDHTQTFTGGVAGLQARALAHEWVLRTLGKSSFPVSSASGPP